MATLSLMGANQAHHAHGITEALNSSTTNGDPNSMPAVVYIGDYEYDVSKWRYSHPGGMQVLEKYNLKDATDIFYAFHEEKTLKLLDHMPRKPRSKEPVKNDPALPGLEIPAPHARTEQLQKNWRKFREQVTAEGILERQYLYYAFSSIMDFSWLIIALTLLWNGNWLLGAIFHGIFYQQWGYLGHDLCHNAVFKSRKANYVAACAIVAGVGTGNLWWKERHNPHHATTNILEVDPDIINLPLFCWDEREIPQINKTPLAPTFIRMQKYSLLPILFMLRLYWLVDTIAFALSLIKHKNKHFRTCFKYEAIPILIYYTYSYYFTIFWTPSWTAAFFYMLISHSLGSFLLASVVFGNHDASPKYDKSERIPTTFVELQTRGTRNYGSNLFWRFFTGGLNFQIEHHLFPVCPRNKLPAMAARVQQFCKENDLVYDIMEFPQAIAELSKQLERIADAYKATCEKRL